MPWPAAAGRNKIIRAGEEPAWVWMTNLLFHSSTPLAESMDNLMVKPDNPEALHQLNA